MAMGVKKARGSHVRRRGKGSNQSKKEERQKPVEISFGRFIGITAIVLLEV